MRQRPRAPPEKTKGWEAIPGIDRESALRRVMGNQVLLEKLLLDFKRDYGTLAGEVRALFTQGEREQSRRLVHQIKGIAGNIGARTLHEAARTLERAIEQGQDSDWPALTEAFEAALQEILAAIATLQPTVSAVEMTLESGDDDHGLGDADRETLKPTLRELADHLTRFSVGSTAVFNAIKPLLLRAGLHHEVEQMSGQIARFKYSEARTSLESIIEQLGFSL
ncbi:hypothetical protein CCP4SC76_820002 [Gammaproteobacteria bacterium]